MASLITTDIIRYQPSEYKKSLRSHVLHPHSDITIVCIIWSEKENVTSVVEDHFLETISSSEWKHGQEDSDFSFVTEKYNHFLSNLAVEDEKGVRIIFAVERDGRLMVSSIGECEVILQEDDVSPSSIHEDTRWHHRFELISSGEIPMNSSVFIVSKNLDGILGDSFYADCSESESGAFAETAKEVLSREVNDTVHMVRIRRSPWAWEKKRSHSIKSSYWNEFKETLSSWLLKIGRSDKIRDIKSRWEWFFERKQSIFLVIFLITWLVIFFLLISYLITALFSVTWSQTKDAKNQIIQAKTLIEASQKLISNPVAFDASIQEAEKLLSELDGKKLYPKDTKELRDKIEAMKKEIYDIQTIDLTKRNSIIPLDIKGISPIGIFEKEKKLFIIGKQSTISDYAVGDTSMKNRSYPSGEVAKDYTVLEDGNFYILTESNRIIASRKSADISYISVTWQEWWENSDGISTFNGNIYLQNSSEGQVYKHKPWLNWFWAKSQVLSTPSPGILDVWIDWGFYVLKNDQKIIRLLWSSWTQTWIILNKIPWEYNVGKKAGNTKIIVRPEINYVYILDGDRVWVFLPDSKRFQDVRSWTYIAQIELSTIKPIQDIAVARDWLIYVLTEDSVYDIVFEFVDNNIILRP